MTDVAEAKKKPRKFSIKQQIKAMKSLKTDIRQMFANAERFCWDQKFLLEARTTSIYATQNYQRLTGSSQCVIAGYWDALMDLLWNKLKCMYLIRGQWHEPQQVGRSGDDGPQFSEAGRENCHYVYVVNAPGGPEYKVFF